jgi:hypothetical protein
MTLSRLTAELREALHPARPWKGRRYDHSEWGSGKNRGLSVEIELAVQDLEHGLVLIGDMVDADPFLDPPDADGKAIRRDIEQARKALEALWRSANDYADTVKP